MVVRLLAVLAFAVCVIAATPVASARAAESDWRRCAEAAGFDCARVDVPLDRAGAVAGTVPLRVARAERPATAPVLVYLSGGPGSAGITEMTSALGSVPELAERYRVVGFDQRGTGRSGLLRCPEVERDRTLRSSRAGAACAARLGERRRFYTTGDSVADLEALRAALGVEKITLFGISYGTELALAYARAHPDRVAGLLLDSVVDPDDRDPFFLAGFRAMGPSLRALCPARCRGIATAAGPEADLARLVARLRAGGSRAGVWYDGRGRRRVVRIGPTALLDLMFNADYNPSLRAALPAAVRAALGGDFAALARLAGEGDLYTDLGSPREFSVARYATVCEETPLPWDPGTPLAARAASATARATALGVAAFSPFDPGVGSGDEVGLCLRWPDAPRAASPLGAVGAPYPAVPTLILQGSEDLRTPPEDSAHVASQIPGARRLVVPGVGHAVTGADVSGCAARAEIAFAAGRAVPTRCRRSPTRVPAVRVPPSTLRGVTVPAAARRLPARVGRTVGALTGVLQDLRVVLSPAYLSTRGGGLRGGRWSVSRAGVLRLTGYSAVRGVRVSGASSDGVLTLRVSGSGGAVSGRVRLRLRDGRLRGVLGGVPVSVRLPRTLARPSLAAKAAARAAVASRPGARPGPASVAARAAVASRPGR